MLALSSASLSFHGLAASTPRSVRMDEDWSKEAARFVVGAQTVDKPWTSGEISDSAGLAELAKKCNPVIGYWDPLHVGDADAEMVGWFRHAEIKHGRIAMAAFVGYCIQANGIHFPWNLQGFYGFGTAPLSHAEISAAGGPSDQWDALPSTAKIQILGVIGILEMWGESSPALAADGQQHYVRGGKPGHYPSFKPIRDAIGQPQLDLWDPFGWAAKQTPEQKEKGLITEINNGRLAMLGIIGLVCASKGLIVPFVDILPIPGVAPYAGEPMAPFSAADAGLPFVSDMLGATFPWN